MGLSFDRTVSSARRALLALLALSSFAPAAFAEADGSTLQIPPGADVAVVVFEDLQCPDCARNHPQLLAAVAQAGVPLVIHDFPIKRHAWAFPAAILARYFSLKSPTLGDQFRSFIFENQPDITPDNLREQAERFARMHNVELPSVVDPDGKLLALVQADYDRGERIGLQYVPLMFVVTSSQGPARWAELKDPQALAEFIARVQQKPATR
jgi:protein-disulfide isomerase